MVMIFTSKAQLQAIASLYTHNAHRGPMRTLEWIPLHPRYYTEVLVSTSAGQLAGWTENILYSYLVGEWDNKYGFLLSHK